MSKYMKSTYEYTKLRRNFGRQPLFQSVPAHLLDSINPDGAQQRLYALRNPVHRQVQATMAQGENETNTKQLIVHEQGINHTEGGWPREVHVYNEDHIIRHRRRIMHDDNYVHTINNLAPVMSHYVDQNNAIDMYQTYFDGMKPQEPVEKYSIRVANVFRDPYNRPVSCVVWTNENNSKLAAAYCDKCYTLEQRINESNNFYLWDINKQTEPIHEFIPESPCWQLACSVVDPEILIAGHENGIVNIFDIRKGQKSVSSSSVYNSHKCAITGLLYIHSRTNTEFFTSSSDGQCLWWDSRNLSKPLDRMLMSIKLSVGEEPTLSNAESVSSIEFDRGLPTKFLCGTESGLVINVNRMGRDHSEVLASYWNAHTGSVHAVHRSPCTLRMFLTCGDWSVRIWSEEVRTAPVIVMRPYNYQVADAAWAPQRFSSFMVICADGVFYYWDLLRKYKEPVASLQLAKHKLTKVTPHADGESVAVGDDHGSLYLLHLSENLTISGGGDKQLMFQTYERETKREHILDARVKEIRLKIKAEEEMEVNYLADDSIDEEEQDQAAEEKYFHIVKEELQQMEEITSSNYSLDDMN